MTTVGSRFLEKYATAHMGSLFAREKLPGAEKERAGRAAGLGNRRSITSEFLTRAKASGT